MYEFVQLYSKNVCNIAYHTIVVKEYYPCVLAIFIVWEVTCFAFKKKIIYTRGVVGLSSIHYPKFKQSHLQRCFHRDNNITFEQGTGCFEFCNDFHSSNQIGFMIIILLRWLATYILRLKFFDLEIAPILSEYIWNMFLYI